MAALSGRSLAPTALYSLSSDELHVIDDPAIRSLLDAPKMEARKYGLAARKAELAAQKDSQMLATATQDEREAAAVVDKDKALLTGLYSGSYRSGDQTGMHTGSLPTADGIRALEAFPGSQQALSSNFAPLQKVTATQLSGLQDELNTLNSRKQSIINSLHLRRQQAAAHAAHDASASDHIRLGRAKATMSARQIRGAMRAAQMAEQRAKEAAVIEANQNAIAKMELEKIARYTGARSSAIAEARAGESEMQHREAVRRAQRTANYHSAMASYTESTQDAVSDDMKTLGELRKMEEAAAPGPHLSSTRWQKPPLGANLPDIDPDHFMGSAPFRDADSLRDYKQVAGSAQLRAAGKAATSQLAAVSAGAGGDGGTGDSILQLLASADKAYDQKKAQAAAARRPSPAQAARLASLDSQVDSQLASLRSEAAKEGVSVAPVSDDAEGAGALTQSGADAGEDAAAVPAAAGGDDGFTSFPTTSARAVEAAKGDATLLDDGAAIRTANTPVAHIAVPLGGHQDASKGRRHAAVPRSTIADRSTEASAVRADGTHGSGRTEEKLALALSDGQRITHFDEFQEPVHMPHV